MNFVEGKCSGELNETQTKVKDNISLINDIFKRVGEEVDQ